jgi:spore germination protein KC
MVEALFMLTTYLILQEADLRMPKTMGQAVSVVGGLVLGQAAISSGIVSAHMIIVVAFSAVSALAIPTPELQMPFSYLLDAIDTLTSKTSSTLLAVIELIKPEERLGDEVFKIEGSAVFKKDKLIGYLDAKETRGLNWIRGAVKLGSVTFLCPQFGKTSVEILRSSSKVKPVVIGNSVTINLNLKNFSNLRRVEKPLNPVKNNEALYTLEQAQDNAILEEVNLVLETARNELGVNIFGFGEKIHATYPKEWKNLEKNWDTIYQNLDINTIVDSTIRATGATLKSLE